MTSLNVVKFSVTERTAAVPRPREGLRRGEIFGSALLQPARSVCERFFHLHTIIHP